ncbi:ankyrin repeat domain-containing protein [Wolbachia endosymbiont (group A) of Pogonocherus hispidulus]|uniref:ankyrin repeat domain-containing protein n=1 Tax=Wolbachia endosymbiont (group A) of Pogonocherus hispidulus TaxID=3066136 RepID=UPI00333FC06A
MYQARWLMLFPKHAVDREYSFRLFTEKKSAKDFDDIVLRYEQDGKIVHRFIQVKHRQGRHKKISIGDLLTPGKNGAFGLIKYLIAYLKIKSSGEFEGEIEDFVIITNDDFDSADLTLHPVRKLRMMSSRKNKGKEISVIRIDTQDEFLDVGDGVRYKFDNSIISYLQENKDFVKREVGREVSDKEIEDFLNKLVFAVNLPSGTELSEIIKSELGKEFSNTDASHFYSRYQEEVLILLEKEGEEFLSYEQAKALIEKIREEILGAVWFDVIEPVASFTGRGRALTALHNVLQRSAKKQAVISQVASISGLGGVGKSELARKYAYKYGKYYGGNVIWINAENFEDMKNSFLRLAGDDRLGIPPKDKHGRDKTIEAIVEEIYAFFARRGRKSLFIFDNAEGYKGIKRFLPSSLHPRHKKPYVLITSRDCKWNVRGEGDIKVIQLDEFGEVEALEFVRKALNIENNLQDREIEELTRELQYFPLALGQAVVYIQDRNEESRLRGDKRFKISDYLKEYQQNAGELLKKGVYENEDRYTKTVLTTWNITMTYICKEYGFEALSILEIMAYLAPDNIRIKEIFSKLITDDKAKLWNAVELLNRYSMIKLREGVVNIHRLVQEVTRLKLQEKGRREKVLRKALELVNSGDLVQDSMSHVTSVWGYASKHSGLIDDFYFNSVYVYEEIFFTNESNPLHLLAKNGSCEAVKAILTHVEKCHSGKLREVVNIENNQGQTPLHIAAENGWLNIVKYLISKGANTNAKDKYGRTPLHIAAKNGEFDMVKYLINEGANVNAKDKFDSTPLHSAAENGELSIVRYLINKGAYVTKDKVGRTLLHHSALYGSSDVAEYLIQEGAHIDAMDEDGNTPLHFAAMMEEVDTAKVLLKHNADVNAKNKDGDFPLHLAVIAVGKKVAVAKILLKCNVDINTENKNGEISLHCAVLYGFSKTVEYFIQKGAEVNAKSRYGGTTLCLAAMTGNVDIAKVLLKHNADVNAKNNEGKTALYYAANNNHQELVELLLAHGASIL